MPAACGLACESIIQRCHFPRAGLCATSGGCVPGTDPKAPDKLKEFTANMGHPCPILECAINKKIDHCFRCEEFPCEIHYNGMQIYSKQLLDMIKGMQKKS